MQFLYKVFVSEKEVVNALPAFWSPRKKEEELDNLINRMRKYLFIKKMKDFSKKLKRTL